MGDGESYFERSGILHLGSKKGGHILTYLCGSLVGGAVMHSLGEGTGSGGGRLPTFSPTRPRYLNFVMSIKNVWELSYACVYCASFHNLVCLLTQWSEQNVLPLTFYWRE